MELLPSEFIIVYQHALIPWIKELDPTKVIILSYITGWCLHGGEAVKRIDGYSWVDYRYLLDRVPILRISYRQLLRHIDRLVDMGIIHRKKYTDENNRMHSYFKLNKGYRKSIKDRKSK